MSLFKQNKWRMFVKKSIILIASLLGMLSSSYVNAAATCQETRADYGNLKLEQRPNPSFVLLGDSVLSRFDSNRSQKVYYFQRNGSLPLLPEIMSNNSYTAFQLLESRHNYLGHDKSNLTNGHTDMRFTPTTIGLHDTIAAFTSNVGENGVGFFCVAHRYYVHGRPTLTETSLGEVPLSSGDVRFEARLRVNWAQFSEAALTNRARNISWHIQTQCIDSGNRCISQNTGLVSHGTTPSDQTFTAHFMPGKYSVKATINDGVSTVTKFYYIDNSNAISDGGDPYPVCPGCMIP
jgi:hypothetical protein